MPRKSDQTSANRNRAAAGMQQPTVTAKKFTKGRDAARTSAQNGPKQEVPARRQQPAVAGNKTTKHSRPDGASAPKTTTKQQAILDLLGQADGTTVAAIMKATGWQQHSVRGFLAGTVRKKLGLTLVSEKVDDQRVYRVVAKKPAKSRVAAAAATPSAG